MRMVVVGLVLLGGCATMRAQWKRDVAERASFDLDCPRQDVTVEELSKGSPVSGPVFGATGCGRRATYTADTRNGVQMNSQVATVAPQAAPAAPAAPQPAPTAASGAPMPAVDVDDANGCVDRVVFLKELETVLAGMAQRPEFVAVQTQASPTGQVTIRLRVRGAQNAVDQRSLTIAPAECADATRALARMVAEQSGGNQR